MAAQVYTAVTEPVGSLELHGEEIHVAGEVAASQVTSGAISADAKLLNPLAFLLVGLMLFVAYRTRRGWLLPTW